MELYLSILNILACLGVVFLHSNSIFWGHPSGMLWISSNFIETFFYWSVPIFFMISGATLTNYRKRYTTATFLHKRFSKTVLPFLFWSVIAGLFISHISKTPMDWNLLHVADNIFNTRYFSVYWFFIPLFSIYLSLPIISKLSTDLKLLFYFIILGVVFVFTLPLICNLLKLSVNFAIIPPPVYGGYIIYVILGFYLDQTTLSLKVRRIIYLFGILGWFIHFEGTTLLSNGTLGINGTFKGYTNLPCFLHSLAIFVFFRHLNFQKIFKQYYNPATRFVYRLASCTFGIYLLHFFLILWLPQTFNIDCSKLSWRIGGGLLIFIICAFISNYAKKLPIINKLIP